MLTSMTTLGGLLGPIDGQAAQAGALSNGPGHFIGMQAFLNSQLGAMNAQNVAKQYEQLGYQVQRSPNHDGFTIRSNEKEKEKSMFGFKEYIQKHKDLVWTIVLAAILDHFLLKGVIRSKLVDIVEGFLAKIKKEHSMDETK